MIGVSIRQSTPKYYHGLLNIFITYKYNTQLCISFICFNVIKCVLSNFFCQSFGKARHRHFMLYSLHSDWFCLSFYTCGGGQLSVILNLILKLLTNFY